MLITAAISEYISHIRVERGLANNTIISYTRDLERYRAFLASRGCERLADVTPDVLAGFVQSLDLATSSVARIVSTVRGFHQFTVEEYALSEDSTAGLETPTPGIRLPKALSYDDVTRLLAQPNRHDPVGLRDAALLELLYGTGARVAEVCALDVDDVRPVLENPDLGLRLIGKGGKHRFVPLGSYAVEALEAYTVRSRPGLAKGSDPAFFLNLRGKRLSRQSAWAVISTAAREAQLPEGISPHTLRHSYATHLLQGGADLRVVQELLGHASVTTTQLYTRVTIDALRDVFYTSHPRAS